MKGQHLKNIKNVFLLCPASQLQKVSQIASEWNKKHILRAIFVKQDVRSALIIPMLERAELRTLRNMIVHRDNDLPRRILSAWKMGAQEKLIAHAEIIKDHLFLLSCDLKRYELLIKDIKPLSGLARDEVLDFNVAEDGSYIHWKTADVHLDMDGIKYLIDSDWRKKRDRERIVYNKRFGTAVSLLRRRHELTQGDIEGVSERQIRRIERGMVPHTSTLRNIARSHGLSIDFYLNEIATLLKEIVKVP